MPACVFKGCGNHSGTVNKSQGVTFHRFPTDEAWKNDWIRIVRDCRNEIDWTPSKFSAICSIHFDTTDFYTTKGSLRRVVANAVPKKMASYDEMKCDESINIKEEIQNDDDDNPFRNVQLEVKEEIDDHYDKVDVKEELTNESLVSYDYPQFDDSMDSDDAVALGNVEACLQDEYIKSEPDNYEPVPLDYEVKIKDETDLTVTETHLISNEVTTITNHVDGIEPPTTKTIVMEILPHSIKNNPEEILPTPTENYTECDNFQLNSITGNVLTLEQEAYGLLEAKKGKEIPKTRYNCPKCTKQYTSKYAFKKHLSVHDTIEKYAKGIIKGKKTRIENLKKKKMVIKIKKQPIKSTADGYECTCGSVFKRKSRLETCMRSHPYSECPEVKPVVSSIYRCIACNRHFKEKRDLLLHRKKVHSKRFACKFCPTDYDSRRKLIKHLQVHQKVQLMEYKVITEVMNGKKLKCFMCLKTYSELSELKSHVMKDHKEPYICPHCSETFSKIIDFANHTKTSHPEVEGQSVLDVLEAFSKLVQAWKCDECRQKFHEADKLALHKLEEHNPIKPESQFQCDDCKRVFITQKGLMSHRRIHHSTESTEAEDVAEQGVMCLECRKICKDMNALTSHMRLHSPDRKYPCKFCDFRFATPEKRKAHSEIHTGDMKYVCFICEYQCSSENRLKRHKMSLKHVNMKEYLLTGKPLIDEVDDKSKVIETVPCDICGDKFVSESEMLTHKQTHPFIEFPNDDKPSRIFFK